MKTFNVRLAETFLWEMIWMCEGFFGQGQMILTSSDISFWKKQHKMPSNEKPEPLNAVIASGSGF